MPTLLALPIAQIAIAAYGLTIKSGYLSDILLADADMGQYENQPQVNTVATGGALIFTPQARWSDGVVRPVLNQDFDGLEGVWTSSNPAVMYVSQQGRPSLTVQAQRPSALSQPAAYHSLPGL